ncbi:MAG TPA: TPM domain-containing protein [Thermoanaerobaculia bacterium]
MLLLTERYMPVREHIDEITVAAREEWGYDAILFIFGDEYRVVSASPDIRAAAEQALRDGVRPQTIENAVTAMVERAAAAERAAALPEPDRYVTDVTGTLPVARLDALNEKLVQFDRNTANQVLIYVAKRLPEERTLEEVARASFNAWGVGQRTKNNGVVVFLFMDDRKWRIETGDGVRDRLTDGVASQIGNDTLVPSLRAGDPMLAIEAVADDVLEVLNGENGALAMIPARPGLAKESFSSDDLRTVAVVVVLMIAGICALLAFLRYGGRRGWTVGTERRYYDEHDHWSDSSTFTSSSSSSSSSSSGSYSGGGGSSSGGGASGSW